MLLEESGDKTVGSDAILKAPNLQSELKEEKRGVVRFDTRQITSFINKMLEDGKKKKKLKTKRAWRTTGCGGCLDWLARCEEEINGCNL